MPKFTIQKTVNASRNNVFSILSNYENYQSLLPEYFPSVRIRSVRDNVAVVEEHMIFGNKEFVIMAKHVTQEPILHDVYVIGGDAKGSHFKQQFIESSEGTKIIVDGDLKLRGKMKLSNLFGKNNFRDDYAKILAGFLTACKT